MLPWLFAAALCVMLLFPTSATGRALRRLLIETPATLLNRLRGGHIALVLLLSVMLGAALALGREGFVVAAQAPEVVAWFAAFDIATYAEAIAAGVVVAATVRFRAATLALRLTLGLLRRRIATGRARRVRSPTRRRAPPGGPGDEPWPAALVAA